MARITHLPVLLYECIEGWTSNPEGILSWTVPLGRAGHSHEIAKRLTTGRLICVDQDPGCAGRPRRRAAWVPWMDLVSLGT